jgi:pimeloyl-ACP methyl ester carboxylesterase
VDLYDLVIIIPGIGGSELWDGDDPVWRGGNRSLIRNLRNPDELAIDRPLTPRGLLQDFNVFPWKHIRGYSELWATVKNAFPKAASDQGDPTQVNLDAQVVAFPYDFRLGVTPAAERLAEVVAVRLAHINVSGRTSRVIVVAHSMGGLVARKWATLPGQAELCRGMITLGTPHRGAPKGLDVLVNGLEWKGITRNNVNDVLRGWPGVHDLIGTGEYVHQAGKPYQPNDIPDLPFAHLLSGSTAMHNQILKDWKELRSEGSAPPLIPYSGTGHPTIEALSWNGHSLTKLDHELSKEQLGDGTVPFAASVPWELGGNAADEVVRRTYVNHGELTALGPFLRQTLETLAAKQLPARGTGDGTELYVGLGVPDLVESGTEIRIKTSVGRAVGKAKPAVKVSATWRPLDGGDPSSISVRDEGQGLFSAQTPAGVNGMLEVRAAADFGDDERRTTEDVVAVIASELRG